MWKFLAFILVCTFAEKLKFEVPAGEEFCFHQDYNAEEEIDIQYMVTQGGNLDIEARIVSPDSHVLALDFQQKNRKAKLLDLHAVAERKGEHMVCFSNKMSRWSKKSVLVQTKTLISANSQQKQELAKLEDLGNMVVLLISIETELNELQSETYDLKTEGKVIGSLQVESDTRIEYLATLETFLTIALIAFQIKSIRSWFSKNVKPVHV